MPRGPLPDPNHRRRNAPAIPTTILPAGGYRGEIPDSPIELGAAGNDWWTWAWRTPQAAAWSTGDDYTVARRASLEDDIATIARVDTIDLVLADVADAETKKQVRAIVGNLAALVLGRLAIYKEMRELDNLLGLTPKGMAALRWRIVAEPKPKEASGPGTVASLDERRVRIAADA